MANVYIVQSGSYAIYGVFTTLKKASEYALGSVLENPTFCAWIGNDYKPENLYNEQATMSTIKNRFKNCGSQLRISDDDDRSIIISRESVQ